MQFWILDFLSQECEEDNHLLTRPAKTLLEHPGDHGVQSSQQILHLPHAEELHAWVLGPRVEWQLEDLLRNISIASRFQPTFPPRGIGQTSTELGGCLFHQVGELSHMGIFGDGVIVAAEDANDGLKFDPASWLQVT